MAPPRRGRAAKVGLKRIDAALDAVRPMGFPNSLVRKSIKTLLEVYGGDVGWPFIEGEDYKPLIESLLEEVGKSETRNEEPKSLTYDESNLLTDNASPEEGDSTQDGHGKDVHSGDNPPVVVDSSTVADIVPCSSRKDAISDNQKLQVDSTHSATKKIVSRFVKSETADATPESHSPSPFVSLATVCTPQVGSCSHRKHRSGDSTQDGHGKEVHSADNPSVVVDSSAVADIVPCSSRKDAIRDNQELQVDSTHSVTKEIVSRFVKLETADATPESHSTSPFVSLATVCTPQVGSCSHRKRRPCYGWLSSSDDEGEPDLVYFTPDAR